MLVLVASLQIRASQPSVLLPLAERGRAVLLLHLLLQQHLLHHELELRELLLRIGRRLLLLAKGIRHAGVLLERSRHAGALLEWIEGSAALLLAEGIECS